MSTISIDRAKKTLHVALIGINPADQVLLKGYLRVVLRLDANLEWVSANHQWIDLLLVEQQLQQSKSIQRLLANKANIATLFVGRVSNNDTGYLYNNQLLLPLKETEQLKTWLFQHISVLKPQSVETVSQPVTDTSDFSSSNFTKIDKNNFSQFVSIIQRLQQREDILLSLKQGQITLAHLHPRRQRIWTIQPKINLQNATCLEPLQNMTFDMQRASEDLVQWLWQQSQQLPKAFLDIVNPNQSYQITSWVKPNPKIRHDLLKLQCALEQKPVTITDIVQRTKLTEQQVLRLLFGLLVAGVLQPSIYQNLTVHLLTTDTKHQPLFDDMSMTIQTPASIQPISEINPEMPPPKPASNHSKLSFLSRLRQKLNL